MLCEPGENDEDIGQSQSQALATRNWHVGGLPVIDDHENVAGMITYTDLLREFVGRDATS